MSYMFNGNDFPHLHTSSLLYPTPNSGNNSPGTHNFLDTASNVSPGFHPHQLKRPLSPDPLATAPSILSPPLHFPLDSRSTTDLPSAMITLHNDTILMSHQQLYPQHVATHLSANANINSMNYLINDPFGMNHPADLTPIQHQFPSHSLQSPSSQVQYTPPVVTPQQPQPQQEQSTSTRRARVTKLVPVETAPDVEEDEKPQTRRSTRAAAKKVEVVPAPATKRSARATKRGSKAKDTDSESDEEEEPIDYTNLTPEEISRREKLAKKAERARTLRRQRLDRLGVLEEENQLQKTTLVEYELTITQQKQLLRGYHQRSEQLELALLYYQNKFGIIPEEELKEFISQSSSQSPKQTTTSLSASPDNVKTMNDNESQQTNANGVINNNIRSELNDEESGVDNYTELRFTDPHRAKEQANNISNQLEQQINHNNVNISNHLMKKLTLNDQQAQSTQIQRQEKSVGLLGAPGANNLNINNINVNNLGLSAVKDEQLPAGHPTHLVTGSINSHKSGVKCPNGAIVKVNPADKSEFEMLHILRHELTTSAERLLHAIAIVNDSLSHHNIEKK